jgi:hypothetical protein
MVEGAIAAIAAADAVRVGQPASAAKTHWCNENSMQQRCVLHRFWQLRSCIMQPASYRLLFKRSCMHVYDEHRMKYMTRYSSLV